MSVPDSTLEPLGQFPTSGDSSWLRKRSANSGLLSRAPDFVPSYNYIPTGSHPAPMITKMLSHFMYLKDAGFDFPAPVQAMIVLCKLPPTMEVVVLELTSHP
ncbi:hypothetical protein SCLCIDRAFT_30357 [Scleroderma citrinum Foug A]|uniref:Uncharacterized protein n=1 Tax=Scleroderma citrinum Foug A TaxID=1036808 RepID=A0A0C2Z0Z9_9AGAM|nr:hypothetical protein SCLCIDRAFT_30357 [Scleroderma citrinum Foug A]